MTQIRVGCSTGSFAQLLQFSLRPKTQSSDGKLWDKNISAISLIRKPSGCDADENIIARTRREVICNTVFAI